MLRWLVHQLMVRTSSWKTRNSGLRNGKDGNEEMETEVVRSGSLASDDEMDRESRR